VSHFIAPRPKILIHSDFLDSSLIDTVPFFSSHLCESISLTSHTNSREPSTSSTTDSLLRAALQLLRAFSVLDLKKHIWKHKMQEWRSVSSSRSVTRPSSSSSSSFPAHCSRSSMSPRSSTTRYVPCYRMLLRGHALLTRHRSMACFSIEHWVPRPDL
jgi:hypothetical protein